MLSAMLAASFAVSFLPGFLRCLLRPSLSAFCQACCDAFCVLRCQLSTRLAAMVSASFAVSFLPGLLRPSRSALVRGSWQGGGHGGATELLWRGTDGSSVESVHTCVLCVPVPCALRIHVDGCCAVCRSVVVRAESASSSRGGTCECRRWCSLGGDGGCWRAKRGQRQNEPQRERRQRAVSQLQCTRVAREMHSCASERFVGETESD